MVGKTIQGSTQTGAFITDPESDGNTSHIPYVTVIQSGYCKLYENLQ